MNFLDDRRLFEHHRFLKLFRAPSDIKISYTEWAKEYDQYYLDWARSIANRKDVDGLVVWKNFNEFFCKDFTDLDVIDEPFISMGINFSGYVSELPINNHVDFFD